MNPYVNIHTHHVGGGYNILDVGEGKEWLIDEQGRELKAGEEVLYSVGIHPLKAGTVGDEDLANLQEMMQYDKVVAIGECGLDRRATLDLSGQERLLAAQVELAERYRKPLIIHCVRAFSELIALRKKTKSTVPWIVHGFNNNEQILRQLLDHEFYISIGTAFFNPQSNAFHLVRKIPREFLFFENDDDDVDILYLYEAASCYLGIGEEDLMKRIWENYQKVFAR